MKFAALIAGLLLASCAEAPKGPYLVRGESCECKNGGVCLRDELPPVRQAITNLACIKQGWLKPKVHCRFDLKHYALDDTKNLRALYYWQVTSIIATSRDGEQCVESSLSVPVQDR